MPSTDDYRVGRGAVALSHHSPPKLYNSSDSVHVSPCFGALSCLVCLAVVALPQDEVGKYHGGAGPGDGDKGIKAQCVHMTKAAISCEHNSCEHCNDLPLHAHTISLPQPLSAGPFTACSTLSGISVSTTDVEADGRAQYKAPRLKLWRDRGRRRRRRRAFTQ